MRGIIGWRLLSIATSRHHKHIARSMWRKGAPEAGGNHAVRSVMVLRCRHDVEVVVITPSRHARSQHAGTSLPMPSPSFRHACYYYTSRRSRWVRVAQSSTRRERTVNDRRATSRCVTFMPVAIRGHTPNTGYAVIRLPPSTHCSSNIAHHAAIIRPLSTESAH